MGPKNKTKVPPKATRMVAPDQEVMVVASPSSPRDNPPTTQMDVDASSEYANDDFPVDYKRLAIEVATLISPGERLQGGKTSTAGARSTF